MKKKLKTNKICQIFRENEWNKWRKGIAPNTLHFSSLSGHLLLLDYLYYYYTCEGKKINETKKINFPYPSKFDSFEQWLKFVIVMITKSFMLKTHSQNAYNYNFTTWKRSRF